MLLTKIKRKLTRLPLPIGTMISHIPYSLRSGFNTIYTQRKKEIANLEYQSTRYKQMFIFERVKAIAEFAYKNIPFYTRFYRQADVNPTRLTCFKDIQHLPILDKSQLQAVELEERSYKTKNRYLINTGGSSGHPLTFFMERESHPHEWAHMHHIWDKTGFHQTRLKILFAGRSNVRNIVDYDSISHQLIVDVYKGWELIADKLLSIYSKYKPQYLHGYPSVLFDFIFWLHVNKHPLLPLLKNSISAIFLGSEAPAKVFRKDIEELINCQSISWYGHTERAILAYEKNEYGIYYPFQSYGYGESLEDITGTKLLGTSYYNYASPLIRYDTGDRISAYSNDGVLEYFEVTHGREGEFIFDKNNEKIFLTALIFGRHHELLNQSKHIQIKQTIHGSAEIHIVLRETSHLNIMDLAKLFDSNNVQIDFSFNIISQPYRTITGKVPLLIQ